MASAPDPFDAMKLAQARSLHQTGSLPEAEALYREVLAAQPQNAEATFLLALTFAQRNRLDEAAKSFAKAARLRPDFVDAQFNTGLALQNLRQAQKALDYYDRAIRLKPDHAVAHYNSAVVLHGLGRRPDALARYEKATKANPDYAEAWYARGVLLHEMARYDDAIGSLDETIRLAPNHAPAHFSRSAALNKLNRYEAAVAAAETALRLNPQSIEALCNRAVALYGLKRYAQALESCDVALRIHPTQVEALNNRGAALRRLQRHEEALASYDAALTAGRNGPPGVVAEAWFGRGEVLFDMNDDRAAKESFAKALAARPDFAEARVCACLADLPVLYDSEAEIARQREAYAKGIAALASDVAARRVKGDLVKGLAAKQPFFLAYQGGNDRDLQRAYGAIACNILNGRFGEARLASPPAVGEKLRVGFVSSFFRLHSNWRMPIKGWLENLDRSRFAVFGYHTGPERDAETDSAIALCERFVEGVRNVEAWRREILADAPHVLIYPGLLMEGETLPLAAQRLAPVQCNAWGHPETSGMPTLDYFLSSDLMEPAGAQEHYSERLVRLPNLSIHVEPPADIAPASRASLGLPDGVPAFWCGQSLYKYLPRFDRVFADIAARVGDCRFVFVRHIAAQRVTRQFEARLERAFAAAGLRAADHCIFLDRLSPQEFVAATGACDIFLDSIGWSGCNSALESLTHDLPIVTTPGEFMRGRHCAAILQMMEMGDTVAATVEDYVELAVRLALEPEARRAFSQRVAASKHRLWRDLAPVRALEDFLLSSVAAARA